MVSTDIIRSALILPNDDESAESLFYLLYQQLSGSLKVPHYDLTEVEVETPYFAFSGLGVPQFYLWYLIGVN